MAGISDVFNRMNLALALWNGTRPDHQGADVRADQQRGQPRRGRQGVLVVPGRGAQPLLAALALPLPAGGLPVRRAGAGERADAPSWSRSTSCSTPASSTTTATGSWRSATRRPTPDDLLMRGDRRATWARNRRPSTCCRRSGSATTWAWDPTLPPADAARRRATASIRAAHAELGDYLVELDAAPDGSRPELLFCENETNAPRIFGTDPITPYPKDGINDHLVSGAADGQPGTDRHQGRGLVPAHRGARRDGRDAGSGCGRRSPAARGPAGVRAGVRADDARPGGRGGRVLRRAQPSRRHGRGAARSCARRSRA